uniref:Phenoloxidase-activating factor 2 n=1 Tax=Anopheles darlingi TaxID=43151 RepID=A0A2M4DPA9_ANODA
MRSLKVIIVGLATLLGYTTIVLAAEQTLDDLINQFTTVLPGKKTPPVTPSPPLPPPVPPVGQKGGPCEGEAVCIQKHLCTNVSTSGVGIIDIRFTPDNPCVDYLLQCCNPEDIIEEPGGNNGSGGDGGGRVSTTVPSVTTTPAPIVYATGCGVRNTNGIGFRITGDKDNETEYGEFPWMMAILKKNDEVLGQPREVYHCGGSLIHNQVVLTAAHCLNKIRASELKVRAGEWDTKTTNEMYTYQDRSVVEIVIHPEYYKGGLHNDLALLFLDSPFYTNKIIQPVCLPPQDAKFDYQTCFATGWGKDLYGKDGTFQTILKKIDLPIVPNDQCQTALRTTELGPQFTLHKSFICAGGVPGKAACKGDGGSPLVCPIPNKQHQYYQTGVVAWGIGCGENGIPGVYANVAKFRKWIDQHMIQRNFGTSSYTS